MMQLLLTLVLSTTILLTATTTAVNAQIYPTFVYTDDKCTKLHTEMFMNMGDEVCTMMDKNHVPNMCTAMDSAATGSGSSGSSGVTLYSQAQLCVAAMPTNLGKNWSRAWTNRDCSGPAYVVGKLHDVTPRCQSSGTSSSISYCQADGTVLTKKYKNDLTCTGTDVETQIASSTCKPVEDASVEMSYMGGCSGGGGSSSVGVVIKPPVNSDGSAASTLATNIRCYSGEQTDATATAAASGSVAQIDCDGATHICKHLITTSASDMSMKKHAFSCVMKTACVASTDTSSSLSVTECYVGVATLSAVSYNPSTAVYVSATADVAGAAGTGVARGDVNGNGNGGGVTPTRSIMLTMMIVAVLTTAMSFVGSNVF